MTIERLFNTAFNEGRQCRPERNSKRIPLPNKPTKIRVPDAGQDAELPPIPVSDVLQDRRNLCRISPFGPVAERQTQRTKYPMSRTDTGRRVRPKPRCRLGHSPDADGKSVREHNRTVGDPSIVCTDSHRLGGGRPRLFRRETVGNCSAFSNLGGWLSRLSQRCRRLLRSFGCLKWGWCESSLCWSSRTLRACNRCGEQGRPDCGRNPRPCRH